MNFKGLLQQRRSEYRDYRPISCPLLGDKVIFNTEGFEHILFRKRKKERSLIERVVRLTLLPFARLTISNATGYEFRKHADIQYWGLELAIGDARIRVVLKKVGNGELQFWSIMQI